MRQWRISLRFRILLCGALLGFNGCATSVEDLWPAKPGAPTKTVYVSLDSWHAMVGFTLDGVRKDLSSEGARPTEAFYEEWGYAERAWYIEGRQGISGVLRALFWPSDGVVEVAVHDRLWADRTPQPPAERYAFALSEEGFRRLRSYLRSTMFDSEVGRPSRGSRFFPARASYHLFHHCHHYVAGALRVAGIPVSAFWSFNKTALAWQLDRLQDSL